MIASLINRWFTSTTGVTLIAGLLADPYRSLLLNMAPRNIQNPVPLLDWSPLLKLERPQDRAISGSGYHRVPDTFYNTCTQSYYIILILQNQNHHALHSPHVLHCTTQSRWSNYIKLAQWSSIKRSNFRWLICRRPRHTETCGAPTSVAVSSGSSVTWPAPGEALRIVVPKWKANDHLYSII